MHYTTTQKNRLDLAVSMHVPFGAKLRYDILYYYESNDRKEVEERFRKSIPRHKTRRKCAK